jgi:hypothetical protein
MSYCIGTQLLLRLMAKKSSGNRRTLLTKSNKSDEGSKIEVQKDGNNRQQRKNNSCYSTTSCLRRTVSQNVEALEKVILARDG